jgi:hypothetical protein
LKKLEVKLFLILIVLLLSNYSGYSQKHFNDKKTLHLAKEYLRIEEYAQSRDLFEELVKQHPENSNFKY